MRLFLLLPLVGCASHSQMNAMQSVKSVQSQVKFIDPTRVEKDEESRGVPITQETSDGGLLPLVESALKRNGKVRSAFENWKAEASVVQSDASVPQPVLRYTYFPRSVETRVGPQTHKLGASMELPWASLFQNGEKAQSLRASAAGKRFEATVLGVKLQVEKLYWQIWLHTREHELREEHDQIVEALRESIRARVATNKAGLAELSQAELMVAMHHDHKGTHRQKLLGLRAKLHGETGLWLKVDPTSEPRSGRVGLSAREIKLAARAHPLVREHSELAKSYSAQANVESVKLRPRLSLGFDYIVTDESRNFQPDSGKDALMVTAMLRVPIGFKTSRGKRNALYAKRDAQFAEEAYQRAQIVVAAKVALANLEDTERRIRLHRRTLIPQALLAYESLLGGYQSGSVAVQEVFRAQERLLELQVGLVHAQAQHAIEWAWLEATLGRTVPLEGREK